MTSNPMAIMKSEDEPITDDEWLLRRVWRDRFRTESIPIISPDAFAPRCAGRDIVADGISLYRNACVALPYDILAEVTEGKREDTGIVCVSVAFSKSLKLTVVSRPQPPISGHVIIPELNAQAY